MSTTYKSTRFASVDLWKFMASIFIMIQHTYQIGGMGREYHFYSAYIYVEFFYMITGYLTMKHFDETDGKGNRCEHAILYTVKKFAPFLIYVIPATLLQYGLECYNIIRLSEHISVVELLEFCQDLPLDLLLICIFKGMPKVKPLWFLSAMLVVFPVFCSLIQMKNKHLLMILAPLPLCIFYGSDSLMNETLVLEPLIKACACLLGGAFIYLLLHQFGTEWKSRNKMLLTVVEVLSLLFTVLCTCENWLFTQSILLCFFVTLILSFSGKTYTANIRGKWIHKLGEISFSIYVWQWFVATVVQSFCSGWADYLRVEVYYVGTLLLAVLYDCLVKLITKR